MPKSLTPEYAFGDMDHNERPAYALEARYVLTNIGEVCVRKQLRCIRCCRVKTFSLLKRELENIVSHGLGIKAGDAGIEEKARVHGWLISYVMRQEGNLVYTLCSKCVRADYERDYQFRKHYAGLDE